MANYDCPSSSLLSTVYSQCWPAPVTRKLARNKTFYQRGDASTKYYINDSKRAPCHNVLPGSMYSHACNSRPGSGIIKVDAGYRLSDNIHANLGLDQGTLHWRSWSSFKQDLDDITDDMALYKITQDTFRQLTQHSQESKNHQNGRQFSGSGFKSSSKSLYYSAPTIHATRLALSLPSHPSIQDHKESESSDFGSSISFHCTTKPKSERQRPKSHDVRSPRRRFIAPQRPHSGIPGSKSNSNFDHLSSQILGQLAAGANQDMADQFPGPFEIVAKGFSLEDNSYKNSKGDDNEAKSPSPSVLEEQRWEKLRYQHEYLRRKVIGSRLLPDPFDPDGCSFDYRSSNTSTPEPDPFPEPLTEPFCFMDLRELSEEKDWRRAVRKVPKDEDVEIIMDRLIELERIQLETCELEKKMNTSQKRPSSVIQEKKGWNSDAAKPTERAHSALGKRKESKNCCQACLQVMCAGDCVEKRPPSSKCCPHCYQRYCTGSCTEYQYHLFVRQPREAVSIKQRPKSCKSCVRLGKSDMNTINANNVILGRPRSAFATFSSAHLQSVHPLKMSYPNDISGNMVEKRMKAMGLLAPAEKEKKSKDTDESCNKRSLPPKRYNSKKVKGRDALQPGKSYQSQRRFSLTEETTSTSAVRCNSPTQRVQSAKYRRRLKSASLKNPRKR